MKYFMQRAERIPHPMPMLPTTQIYEITPKRAFKEYVECAGKGMKNLTAKPWFDQGATIHRKWYSVWGEDVNDRQVFKRRLEGIIAQEVKDI